MIDDLFPTPSPPPSRISPNRWPGASPESTEVLRATLKDNHEKWHIYFNDKRFQNHTTHYVLALWALGADAEIIKAAYDLESAYQRPRFTSPNPITAHNFGDHLGDERYYSAYLEYYTKAIQSKDAAAVLEEHIFSREANFSPAGGRLEMLNRFLDGLTHPMIHTGYGLEFGLPGIFAEGLASAAVHKGNSAALIPEKLWELSASAPTEPKKNVHAFTILARMLKDPRFDNIAGPEGDASVYLPAMKLHGDAVQSYVSRWTFDTTDPKEAERKIEELVWANTIIYGIGGWAHGKNFNADFMFMHLVTSCLFLPSVAAHLTPKSQALLLRAYFAVSLTWWIARGRPGFDISAFFAADTAHPAGGLAPPPHPKALSAAGPPNAWLPILRNAVVTPDDHLPKLQRALAHYGVLYGTRAAGLADFVDTGLEGAEKLDGTLFVRAAGLTDAKFVGIAEDEDIQGKVWDRAGFYKS